IRDIAMQGNELAVAALNRMYFWGMGDTDSASLNATYHSGYTLKGVVWEDDEMVINDSGQLESHLVENLKNNINVGTRHGSLGLQSGGSNDQIIKLKNGYAAATYGQLSFIDESKNIISTIETELLESLYIQMVAYERVLFVSTGYPSEVAVYDTSDLSNVTELTRIKRNYTIYGNVAVKDNYLYIPVVLENGRFAITPYNISNPAEPVELPSVEVGRSTITATATATLHIDGNYLIAIGFQGALFDISVPEKPALVDENLEISTNGIGAGFENDLFTVPINSAGRLQRSQINFAPKQGDLTLNLDEDGQTMTALSPSDNENDSVTFSILDEPTKGTVTIQDNTTLSYVGAGNANGTDTAKLLVTDAHGGASEFDLTINIKPINDAPLFNNQPVTMLVGLGQTKRVALDVTDVDGDRLTFEITDQATLGSADVDSQGVVTYAPNTSTAGTDSFVVMVSDAVGVTASKKVNVTISTQPVSTDATGNSNDSSGGTVSWFYLLGLLLVGMQRRYTL
ncbi:Ig-like domain-containing protein, partial [Pseudoalteromonas sp. MMG012]|uniref:Ig-like domain-containing protein n=1 Tax=Pseudoalteromonas sp. MMG012 TaxID=2822686 RepID=UPI001B39E189